MPINIDGKYYQIDGENILLFPISKLSQALTDAGYPRDVQILRKWEVWGILPPSIFSTGKVNRKRLYSKEQIEVIVAVAKHCNIRQGSSLKKFSELVWKNLEILNSKFVKTEEE